MMKSNRTKGHIFHFSIEVSRNTKEAYYELANKNGNTNWEDAMKDNYSLFAFSTFEEQG
jgi:cobyrinic acid a,c-diamide synthase